MLSQYEKFRLLDGRKINNFYGEVNWDLNDKSTNECKVIKFTFPNGDTAYVKKEYLNSLMFIIGTAEEQRKLIPQKVTEVRMYQTMLGITANKNIMKGEKINVTVKIPIPSEEKEIIGNLRANKYIVKKI